MVLARCIDGSVAGWATDRSIDHLPCCLPAAAEVCCVLFRRPNKGFRVYICRPPADQVAFVFSEIRIQGLDGNVSSMFSCTPVHAPSKGGRGTQTQTQTRGGRELQQLTRQGKPRQGGNSTALSAWFLSSQESRSPRMGTGLACSLAPSAVSPPRRSRASERSWSFRFRACSAASPGGPGGRGGWEGASCSCSSPIRRSRARPLQSVHDSSAPCSWPRYLLSSSPADCPPSSHTPPPYLTHASTFGRYIVR